VLTSEMKPMIKDGSGKLIKSLPDPNQSDDPELSTRAVEEWKQIKKEIKDASKTQIIRLESAMVTGRLWDKERFHEYFVKHPLLGFMARMIVWGGFDGEGNLKTTFRIDEDQNYFDQLDEPASIDGCHRFGIVHPLHLHDSAKKEWSRVLISHKIKQPFAQIDREIFLLSEDHKDTLEIRDFGKEMKGSTFRNRVHTYQYLNGDRDDHGTVINFIKTFHTYGISVYILFEGYIMDREITISTVYFQKDGHKVPPGEVPSMVYSEVYYDMKRITAKE
jgi:hypothetical protein